MVKQQGDGTPFFYVVVILVVITLFTPSSTWAGMLTPGIGAGGLLPDQSFFDAVGSTPQFFASQTHVDASAGTSTDFGGMDVYVAHKYSGYGALVMAGLAAVSSSSHGLHRAASYGATGLAGIACATGFMGYDGYIDLSDGFSGYDTHAVLGTVGTMAFAATVIAAEIESDDSGHGGPGIASAAAMGLSLVAVKVNW